MMKGKRLHDMMCSISDIYFSLYCEKSLNDRLCGELKLRGKIPCNEEGYTLICNISRAHLIKKGFIDD